MRLFKPNIAKLETKRNLPRLAKALYDKDTQVSNAASDALVRIGEDSIPHLINQLIDRRHLPKVRDIRIRGTNLGRAIQFRRPDMAVDVLGKFGAKAVQPVARALDNSNPDAQVNLLQALVAIGPDAVEAVSELNSMLEDTNSQVRVGAMSALAAIGPEAREAVPRLINLMRDNDYRRDEAWIVNPSKLIEHMAASFNSTCDASTAIRAIGASAVPALLQALRTSGSAQRHNVALILGEIDHDVGSTVPALVLILTDSDSVVRMSSAWALGRIGGQATNAIPPLRELLNDTDERVRAVAVDAIERILG